MQRTKENYWQCTKCLAESNQIAHKSETERLYVYVHDSLHQASISYLHHNVMWDEIVRQKLPCRVEVF